MENVYARVSFLIKLQGNFIRKEVLAKAFSCEFWKISKNTFFTEQLWWLLLQIFLFPNILGLKMFGSLKN